MKKLLLLCLLLTAATGLRAQDTLWVRQQKGKPYLLHTVKSGETLFLLSRKYSVPPAVLADLNEVSYQDGLAAGSKFRIPVDNYNFIRIESVVKSRPIFYRVAEDDDLRSISRMFNVAQSAIQRWNKMDIPDVPAGATLHVGWIAYDSSQVPFPPAPAVDAPASPHTTKTAPGAVPAPEKVGGDNIQKADSSSTFEPLYEQQTLGAPLNEESGAATFYRLRLKTAPGVYYAMHNTAARGTIIKVTNPATGKTVYVKVIGTIPRLKEYHNSIIAISSNAAAVLGAIDRRMFCKLQYR